MTLESPERQEGTDFPSCMAIIHLLTQEYKLLHLLRNSKTSLLASTTPNSWMRCKAQPGVAPKVTLSVPSGTVS